MGIIRREATSMIIGIAGGLVMGGLVLGAISGSVWLLLGFAVAGFAAAGLAEATRRLRHQSNASCKYAQYPPYGY